ncbi:MAG: alkaline phosphatase family protein [archaeon]
MSNFKKLFPTAVLSLILAGTAIGLKTEQKEPEKEKIENTAKPDKNILILGWDGVQRDEFFDCYNKEEKDCPDGLPNILKLSEDNIFEMTITNGQSCTKPGWSQIFTGYEVEDLGIYDNLRFEPMSEGYTVFERLEDHFGDNITTIFIGGKDGNIGGKCKLSNSGEIITGEPWCRTKSNIDHYEIHIGVVSEVSERTFEILEEIKDERFFMFVQYKEPDFPGIHFFTADSNEYRRELRAVDTELGRIMDWLKENNLDDDTIVYVITDHGAGSGLAHRNAPYGIFATTDERVMREADRMDFAPTWLEFYGLDPDTYLPEIDGTSLYQLHDLQCIPEGSAYLDYKGAPECCPGLESISLEKDYIHGRPACVTPVGDVTDNSGYCTDCGNGSCDKPENKCNCPEDCK